MSAAESGASVTIENQGSLDLHGYSFELTDGGGLKGGGLFILLGSESVQNLSSIGTTSTGTVLYYGTGSYTGLAAGNNYYNLNLNDGLVAYMKLDETSGTRAADSSGYGNSGSLIGGASISTTVAPVFFTNARSVDFDGTDDYIKIFDSPSLQTSRQVTFAAWIKPDTFEDSTPYLKGVISKYQNPSAYGPMLRLGDGTLANNAKAQFTVLKAGTEYKATTSTALTAGKWYHIAGTYDGAMVRIYVNGAQDGSTALTGAIDTTTDYVTIGNDYTSDGATSNRDFDGIIDDVRIYGRALSVGEIAGLVAGSEPSLTKATHTLNAALDVDQNITLNGGTLDVSSSNYGVTVGGSFLNNGGVFNARLGTVTFDGTTSGLSVLSGGQSFNALTLNGAGSTYTLADRLTTSGALTLTSGTLDVSSTGNFTVHAGSVTQTSGVFTPRSGILVLTSPAAATDTITSTLNTLHIEDPTENGLVGYWKFDEGTNTGSIIDSSGFVNTAVRRGSGGLIWSGSTLPSLAFDDAFSMKFNGISDHVSVPTTTTLDLLNTDMTISTWINIAGNAGTYRTIVSKNTSTANAPTYEFGLSSSNKLYWYQVSGSSVSGESTSTPSTGAWHHVVFVFVNSSKTGTFYLDGVQDGTVSGLLAPSSTSNPLYIGVDAPSGSGESSFFNGYIDDVRIYNRALTASEVANLANGYYADGANGTATFTLGANLGVSTVTILSGKLGGSTRTLSVTGDWNNYAGTGSFVAGTSKVDLTGSSTQNVRGSTNFYTFEISTAATQTVKFGSGTTQGASGLLTLTGQSSSILTLSPLVAATTWYLNVDSAATQSVSYVTPSYSNASLGAAIIAYNGTNTDGSNNLNWLFTDPSLSSGNGGRAGHDATQNRISQSGGGGSQQVTYTDTEAPSLADVGIADEVVTVSVRPTGSILSTSLRDADPIELSRRVKEVIAILANKLLGIAPPIKQEVILGMPPPLDTERRLMRADRKVEDQQIGAHAAPSVFERNEGFLVATVLSGEVTYRDVPLSSWFAPYVATLIEGEIAQGYKDEEGNPTGIFGVENPVTRAEALKMILLAAKQKIVVLPPPRNKSALGSWASSFVSFAETNQLSIFTPETDVHAPATRGEVVQLILEISGIPLAPSAVPTFTDVSMHYPYASAIATAAFYGLVTGDDGTSLFRPDETINRAEVAKIAALVLELLK